jgi:hypothetical protein
VSQLPVPDSAIIDLATFSNTTGEFRHTIRNPENGFFDKACGTLIFGVTTMMSRHELHCHLGDANPEFFIAVHYHTVEWLVKNGSDT